jgi:S1-C subfamily serine protease
VDGDDGARRDVLRDVATPSGRPRAEQANWPVRPASDDDRADWPVYEAGSTRRDGVDDTDPAPRRRRPWGLVAAVAGVSAALIGAGVTLAGGPSAETASVSRAKPAPEPKPFVYEWSQADASLTAGLVRVRVTADVEADGIVLGEDGLIATSYARLVGLNGSAAAIEAVELDVIADGGMPMRARLVGFDLSRDVAVLRVQGYTPASVAKAGKPVRKGDALTLLDDQGEDQPIVGAAVKVAAVNQQCSRSGAQLLSRPEGFQFSLDTATAEPGGAVVRADGTVVGMYFGGDSNPRCAVPIADVAAVVRDVGRKRETATTRVGPPGGLGIQVYAGAEDAYPKVTAIDVVGDLAEAAGVKLGDVLIRVDGTSLRSKDLTRLGPEGVIRSLEPGRTVAIEWRSGGVPHRAEVKVGVGAQPNG